MAAADRFRPAAWLPGADLQTIIPSLWPAPAVEGAVERRIVAVAAGSAVRLEINRPPAAARATLLLVHGMCGSAESTYMRRTANRALGRSWIAVRMNLRNCGETEYLTDSLYNAGQSEDLEAVLREMADERFPRPLFAVGFSLGGNIVLRHAGLAGDACAADAVAAVNPPIDLEACARAIERPRNRFYQLYYTRQLCAQLRQIVRVRPVAGPAPSATRVRSVRQFDTLYTAPDAGFASAEEYYATASAGPTLSGIRRPALLLAAQNDPVVPCKMFAPHREVAGLSLVQPARGGHCGYWQSGRPRFWAAETVLHFLDEAGRAASLRDRTSPLPQC